MKLFIVIYILLKLTINCEQICPKCNQVFEEGKFHVTDDIIKRRWQTPKSGDENYQPSYQDFHSLVGYADIKYTDLSLEEADVCIVATHRNRDQVELKYFFNDEGQSENCRRFNNQFQKGNIHNTSPRRSDSPPPSYEETRTLQAANVNSNSNSTSNGSNSRR